MLWKRTRAELPEVLGGARHNIGSELNDDAACCLLAYHDVEEDPWIVHGCACLLPYY